jgi:hypothetical protein
MAGVQSRMNVATIERDLLLKQQKDAKGEGLGTLAGCCPAVVLAMVVHIQPSILKINALLRFWNGQSPVLGVPPSSHPWVMTSALRAQIVQVGFVASVLCACLRCRPPVWGPGGAAGSKAGGGRAGQ